MERELWSVLYKLAWDCDPVLHWLPAGFFRLRDRWCLPLGGAARTIDKLGV
jgi:hypothetical protein